jgi:hypothetical protein
MIQGEGEDSFKRGVFTHAQLSQGYDKALASNSTVKLLMPILGETGCRLAEVVGLRLEDINLTEDLIHIRPNRVRRLKTPGSTRTLPLVGCARLAVEQVLITSDDEWLFPRYIHQDQCKATHASNALNKWLKADPSTGLVINGRERLLFDLSNEVTVELVRGAPNREAPTAQEIADRLWVRFNEEADTSDNKWTKADAKRKADARHQELENGDFKFTARAETNTLLPTEQSRFRLDLVTKEEGQRRLESSLKGFFSSVEEGNTPRQVVKVRAHDIAPSVYAVVG